MWFNFLISLNGFEEYLYLKIPRNCVFVRIYLQQSFDWKTRNVFSTYFYSKKKIFLSLKYLQK